MFLKGALRTTSACKGAKFAVQAMPTRQRAMPTLPVLQQLVVSNTSDGGNTRIGVMAAATAVATVAATAVVAAVEFENIHASSCEAPGEIQNDMEAYKEENSIPVSLSLC
jgi:hypothetical protein